MTRTLIAAGVFALAALAPRALAQCADGSAPPCRTAALASRAEPMDDKRWIVLPFTNTARAADIAWLSDASVDLLSLDLSRWTDIRVVDADRVAELVRQLPDAERARIGLESGIALAKRAGAAQLVLGQYVREGSRTMVTARVFSVRTGERMRVAEDTVATMDSVPSAYRRLAPKVLNLRPPPGATLTGLGTSSTQAARAYTLGVQAANRGRSDSATFFFLQAVESDSMFALAHFRLSAVINASPYVPRYPGGAARARATAARLSNTLPERERLVIGAGLTACEKGSRLLALDSADAEGWVATGNCYRNQNFVIVGADGSVRREASLEAARRAYERALSLGPQRGAVVGLQYLAWLNYGGGAQGLCPAAKPACPQSERYWAAPVLRADTISAVYEPWRAFDPPWRRKEFEAPRRAMLAAFSSLLRRTTALHPDDLLGQAILGSVFLRAGQPDSARVAFTRATELATLAGPNLLNRSLYYYYRLIAELQSGHPERVNALSDSILRSERVWARNVLGRFAAEPPGPDTLASAAAALRDPVVELVVTGVVSPDFERSLAAFVARAAGNGAARADVYTTLAFHALRRRAGADTASEFSLYRYQAFLARGDTAQARRALDAFDAWGRARSDLYWDGYEMFAAESHLELGDTTAAWARIAPFAAKFEHFDLEYAFETTVLSAPFPGLQGATAGEIIGRTWLLYADLAMATGHAAEARRGYRMVVGMWEKADAVVQPLVKRAKDALAKLGTQ